MVGKKRSVLIALPTQRERRVGKKVWLLRISASFHPEMKILGIKSGEPSLVGLHTLLLTVPEKRELFTFVGGH